MVATNSSELQAKDLILFKERMILNCLNDNKNVFTLRPQGADSIIHPVLAIHLMTVKIDKIEYNFGGITERFYDEVVRYFDNEL